MAFYRKLFRDSCAILVCVVLCNAHLCLLNPAQRGPPITDVGLNKPGSPECFQVDGPCGKQPISKPSIVIVSDTFQVVFQKNLNHYNSTLSEHGRFVVSLMSENSEKQLTVIPDKGEPSLHVYVAVVKLPSGMLKLCGASGATIQVVYETKNPAAPPKFYQCADVTIQSC